MTSTQMIGIFSVFYNFLRVLLVLSISGIFISVTMHYMMDNLLSVAAGQKMAANYQHTPMDLSWNKQHACESFVDQEDLRSEPCLSSDESSTFDNWKSDIQHHTSTSTNSSTMYSFRTSTPENSDMSGEFYHFSSPSLQECSAVSDHKDEVKVKEEPSDNTETRKTHPFSIASLLGDDIDVKDVFRNEDKPAYITSTYLSILSARCMTSQTFVNQPRTRLVPEVLSVPTMCSPLQESYWCHVCNAICTSKIDAAKHQMFHRMQNSKCNLRRHLFNQHGYVTTHEKSEYSEEITCGLCGKSVAMCFFTKHQRLHDGHVCNLCEQEFSTNSRLQDHMNVHTGLTTHACNSCDRKFSKKSSLTQHQRYHREYQKYSCNYCGKCFNSKYTCTVHERLHTGDNPFRCEEPGCNRAFPQKIHLRLHRNLQHHKSATSW